VAAETSLLCDTRGNLPREYVFDDVAPSALEAVLGESAPGDVPYQCLLVRTAEAVVLVDTGLGPVEHPFGAIGGRLTAELEGLGVVPEAVGLVVLTHGHLDHVGGSVRAGAPAFPNARYVMPRLDWETFTSEAKLAEMSATSAAVSREQLPPLAAAGVLDLVDAETEVAPGVVMIPAPGHTHGHMAVEVAGELLYLADALLHEIQATRPEWGHGLDADPQVSAATLRALFGRAVQRDLPVACAHIDGVFRVEPEGDTFRLTPL
jgi:glyoxylase-like metal-dependent hydrolase (beta-lactamase superfamily II)